MDLSQFKNSSVSIKSKASSKASNPITKGFSSVKDWVYPPLTTIRQQRMEQYKNLAIFGGAVLLVAYFQDKIKNILEIDVDLAKMGVAPGQF